MKQIVEITDSPKQVFSFQLDNGGLITIKLYFVESQIGWFIDIEYNGIVTNCRRLTNCPNLLRDKVNIYPFGIACTVEDGQEPWFIDDFTTGRVKFYILNEEEVNYVEESIYGKVF